MIDTTNKYTLLIGNPGVGKSTLINGLAGKVVSPSGVSFGSGLTTCLQLYETEPGHWYGDTPGLDDLNLRRTAAEVITDALKKGGKYKLLFVVTEEEGRVRPADATTMKLVLDAIRDQTVPYGIVVNKVTEGKKKILAGCEIKKNTFVACLNKGRENTTGFIHLYGRKEELESRDNALHDIDLDFLKFLEMLPYHEIKPDDVNKVKTKEFEEIIENLEAKIRELHEDKQRMVQELQEVSKKLSGIQLELKKKSQPPCTMM